MDYECVQPHRPLVTGDGGDGPIYAPEGEHRPREKRALVLCGIITLVVMVVEVIGGLWTGSLMLLSDAIHMLSHALSLGVSYLALRLAAARPGPQSHFGYFRAEILGAFVNGIGVLAFTGWILLEAAQRLRDPVPILGAEMTAIAVLGLLANLVTAGILWRAGADDLNTKSAFLHMLADTLSSVVIVAGGVVMWLTGVVFIDVALSALLALMVLRWGVILLRDSSRILLEMAPKGVSAEKVAAALIEETPHVVGVHDVHIWEITSGFLCLTAHLVVDESENGESHRVRDAAADLVRREFGVGHATLQIEEARPTATSG